MTFSAMALGINQTRRQFIAVGSSNPQCSAYEFSTSGYGTRWLAAAGNRPGSVSANGPSFNPSNSALSFIADTGIAVYPWPPTGSNFPTKYANPVTMPTAFGNRGSKFSPSGQTLALGSAVYPWSSSGFGTRYADPVSPDFIANPITWNPQETVIVSAVTASPYQSAFAWSTATGFGTKYADPATLPANNTTDVDFSPSGNDIAFSNVSTGPYVTVYPWSSGYGTKYANPVTAIPNNAQSVKFSPSGNDIAIAHATSPYVSAYPWASGFGTKYADALTLLTNQGQTLAFSRTGDAICIGTTGTPYINTYVWNSGVGFGTKYSNPTNLPSSTAYVAFG